MMVGDLSTGTSSRSSHRRQIAREPIRRTRLSPDRNRRLPAGFAAAVGRVGPDGRQTIAVALFARLDVLGFQRLEYELTPDAIDLGLHAALPPALELNRQIGGFGRGERASG